jgi:hypothetical protein
MRRQFRGIAKVLNREGSRSTSMTVHTNEFAPEPLCPLRFLQFGVDAAEDVVPQTQVGAPYPRRWR